jgi:hypothetical protein
MANDDDIDYEAEGANPPHEKDDPTNEGYDEAAHSGPRDEGALGTTGGGTYEGGMHVENKDKT